MDFNNSGSATPQHLTNDSLPLFFEGINLILSQWTALQIVVDNGFGTRNSRLKTVQQLATDIFSWFSKSRKSLGIEGLDDIIYHAVSVPLSCDFDDGSIESTVNQLWDMHEQFLEGNYGPLEKLRSEANSQSNVVPQSSEVAIKMKTIAKMMRKRHPTW
ncbi:hypothetical protein GIB67_032826 [Kingdonia uniflora]|uniref:Pre-rRNA-processing protein TSR2 homolog n=1 Tax=Kingdonia uniflora TaxID=39325 RepID=A0A7J7NCL6_9MAGN|nr:hypothetical protein GIB67_032826 [Kingdonia uniflora]